MEGNISLHYFQINGKAAIARALLSYGKTEYTNKMYTFEEWPSSKSLFEYGQLPVLEVDGNQYSQSIAIYLYLAKKFNLLGNSAEDLHAITNLLCSSDDLAPKLSPVLFPRTDEQKEKLEENTKVFLEFVAPVLRAYEQRAVKNGGKYMVGDGFTLADVYVAVMYKQVFGHVLRESTFLPVLKENAPTVLAIAQSVESNELSSFFNNNGWLAESPF